LVQPIGRGLHAVANAPIFSYHDTFFGLGIVGCPMHSLAEGSRGTAAVAIRILGGEKPSDIKIPASGFATPKFDWRENAALEHQRAPPAARRSETVA
jgi:hypothetical protein